MGKARWRLLKTLRIAGWLVGFGAMLARKERLCSESLYKLVVNTAFGP